MTLSDYIREMAQEDPNRDALVYSRERLSYGELEERSNQTARYLLRLGLRKGDRLGVLMPNLVENVLFFLGALKVGCIEVNLHPDTGVEAIVRAFQETDISALVCMHVPGIKVCTLVDTLPRLNVVVVESGLFSGMDIANMYSIEEVLRESREPALNGVKDSDLALIQFTSGSTGEPKGATLTQKNFISASRSRQEILAFGGDSRIMNFLKLSHSCSKSLLFDAFVTGATMVLSRGFMPPFVFLNTVLKENITSITGPPFVFHHLLKVKNDVQVMDRLKTCLKYLEIGLAGAPTGLFYDLRETFPWVNLINRYGVTENAGAASLMMYGPREKLHRVGTSGRGTSATFLETVPVVEQENGNVNGNREIMVKGSTLMEGYWHDLREGRLKDYQKNGFRTGDLGGQDTDNFFFVVGRRDDMMNVAGEKIFPKEIEDVVAQIPGIEEVRVFGIEDGSRGEKIVVCYHAPGGVEESEVQRYCSTHIPSFMMPHVYAAIDKTLPKNHGGKICKRTLREKHLTLENKDK